MDLPPESNVANLAAITLPENVADIEVTLPEISLLCVPARPLAISPLISLATSTSNIPADAGAINVNELIAPERDITMAPDADRAEYEPSQPLFNEVRADTRSSLCHPTASGPPSPPRSGC